VSWFPGDWGRSYEMPRRPKR